METRDFKAIADLGSALWADGERARVNATDIVATVALQRATDSERLEKAARAMLEAATRSPNDLNTTAMHEPFYRLSPEERITLSALYHGRWSYARLARVLGLTQEQVQEIAWGARLDLATAPTGRSFVPHPVGSGGPSCPEYVTQRPWTQRFLDEEMSTQERTFIQTHAEVCAACRQALSRARQLFYAVRASVPAMESSSSARFVASLGATFQDTLKLTERDRVSFVDSWKPTLARADVRALLIALAVFAVMQVWFS